MSTLVSYEVTVSSLCIGNFTFQVNSAIVRTGTSQSCLRASSQINTSAKSTLTPSHFYIYPLLSHLLPLSFLLFPSILYRLAPPKFCTQNSVITPSCTPCKFDGSLFRYLQSSALRKQLVRKFSVSYRRENIEIPFCERSAQGIIIKAISHRCYRHSITGFCCVLARPGFLSSKYNTITFSRHSSLISTGDRGSKRIPDIYKAKFHRFIFICYLLVARLLLCEAPLFNVGSEIPSPSRYTSITRRFAAFNASFDIHLQSEYHRYFIINHHLLNCCFPARLKIFT